MSEKMTAYWKGRPLEELTRDDLLEAARHAIAFIHGQERTRRQTEEIKRLAKQAKKNLERRWW